MAAQFTLFPQLITEMRLEIWQLTLPAPLQKALYPWRKGCWVIEEMGVEPDPNGEDLEMRFDLSLLEPLRIKMPLFNVNREARDVALKYMKKNKLTASRDTAHSHYHRLFDVKTDIMFVRRFDVCQLEGEAIERLHEPDMIGRFVGAAHFILDRLAVTYAGLEMITYTWMDELFGFTGSLRTLYVVDLAEGSRVNLDDVGNQSIFSSLRLADNPHARLFWSSYRREWEASGDERTVERMRGLVARICRPGSSASECDLAIEVVRLTALS